MGMKRQEKKLQKTFDFINENFQEIFIYLLVQQMNSLLDFDEYSSVEDL
jgi:hypothetical protein